MQTFETQRLPVAPIAKAPDGTDVRVMLQLGGGSFAHFELAPGSISIAVTHKTVEEIWFVLAGKGEMWRKQGAEEEIVPIDAGTCLTIPLGTHFQFRSYGYEPLVFVVTTMPPWPGADEGQTVTGPWEPTVTV
jgi:mannose-6-phosphate isomerase-like protein (cupin superfamily)